ncbi:MAG: CHASE4 domain-containing protein, partial [Desulfarculaceae bacterium]
AREIRHLGILCNDWAAWDDTYEFAAQPNQEYRDSNLLPETFSDNRLNLIYIYDRQGRAIWGETHGLAQGELISLKEFAPGVLAAGHPLISHHTIPSVVEGIFLSECGPLLIASRPITTSNNKGPIRGAVVMGRFLDQPEVKRLAEQTRVDFKVWSLGDKQMPAQAQKALAGMKNRPGPVIDLTDPDSLLIFGLLADISGSPALLIEARVPRTIIAKGRQALEFVVISVLAAGVVILLGLWAILQKTVLAPLARLKQHVVDMGQSQDLEARLDLKRQDELGALAEEFNRMVGELATARRHLLEQSYYSGQAETAAGVLHNVGNVLSPMVLAIDRLKSRLKEFPFENVSQAADDLAKLPAAPGRARDLAEYLKISHQELLGLCSQFERELGGLLERSRQIEQVLADHQRFARAERPLEKIKLDQLLQDSLALVPEDLRKIAPLNIGNGLSSLGTVQVPRVPLMQVIANLITNAAESIERAGQREGRIDLEAKLENSQAGEMVHISISDNGQGLDPAAKQRIFERGYSSKTRHSAGLGLHWCANTVAAMKGRIYANSKGIGLGADFHILFPRSVQP